MLGNLRAGNDVMKLFLDACTIIYRLEQSIAFSAPINTLLQEAVALHGTLELVVSRLSLLECRIKPLRDGNKALLADYDRFFASPGLTVVELSASVVDRATSVRATYGLRTPDALQAACCMHGMVGMPFMTADPVFRRIPDMEVWLINQEPP